MTHAGGSEPWMMRNDPVEVRESRKSHASSYSFICGCLGISGISHRPFKA